ncbi:MAG: VanZ family protein [Salinimicrobium sp.]
MKVKILFFLPALAYTLLVLYLSLINLAETPIKNLGISDKLMHGGAYFGLGLLWSLFVIINFENNRFFAKLLIVCLSSIAFGIFIEVLQKTLTSYRQLDFYDVVANSIGVIISVILVWSLKDFLIRLKGKINLFFMKK